MRYRFLWCPLWDWLTASNFARTFNHMAPLLVKIRAMREAKGWTQGELAERAGVTRATVNRIENGKPRSIDLEVLDKLANALGVPAGLLIVSESSGTTKRRRGK